MLCLFRLKNFYGRRNLDRRKLSLLKKATVQAEVIFPKSDHSRKASGPSLVPLEGRNNRGDIDQKLGVSRCAEVVDQPRFRGCSEHGNVVGLLSRSTTREIVGEIDYSSVGHPYRMRLAN